MLGLAMMYRVKLVLVPVATRTLVESRNVIMLVELGLAVRPTFPAKPNWLVRVMIEFPFPPRGIDTDCGVDVTLKSGFTTMTVMMTECLIVALVPVTLIA